MFSNDYQLTHFQNRKDQDDFTKDTLSIRHEADNIHDSFCKGFID